MSGDRGYGDLDIISYGTKNVRKGKERRSSSIRTNHARKDSIGNNGGRVRDGEMRNGGYPQSRNIKTIHTKNSVRSSGGVVSVTGDVRIVKAKRGQRQKGKYKKRRSGEQV